MRTLSLRTNRYKLLRGSTLRTLSPRTNSSTKLITHTPYITHIFTFMTKKCENVDYISVPGLITDYVIKYSTFKLASIADSAHTIDPERHCMVRPYPRGTIECTYSSYVDPTYVFARALVSLIRRFDESCLDGRRQPVPCVRALRAYTLALYFLPHSATQ